MANAEEQRRLDELMNDVNFPMPGPEELDLDFDFDFDASKSYRSGKEPSLPVRESIVDQQYGAVAALATQAGLQILPEQSERQRLSVKSTTASDELYSPASRTTSFITRRPMLPEHCMYHGHIHL